METDEFENKIFLGKNPFSIQKDFLSPSTPPVLYPSPKD